MFGKELVVTALVGIASMALPAFSRSENLQNNEISVQAFGSFVKGTTDNGIENKATNSGVLASYRYFFNAHSGVEADYGYALDTETYGSSNAVLGVKSHTHELSAACVYRLESSHFTPSLLAGVSGFIIDPKNFAGASTQGVLRSSMAAVLISTSGGALSFELNIAVSFATRRLMVCRYSPELIV